jgi:hypothetical protein
MMAHVGEVTHEHSKYFGTAIHCLNTHQLSVHKVIEPMLLKFLLRNWWMCLHRITTKMWREEIQAGHRELLYLILNGDWKYFQPDP